MANCYSKFDRALTYLHYRLTHWRGNALHTFVAAELCGYPCVFGCCSVLVFLCLGFICRRLRTLVRQPENRSTAGYWGKSTERTSPITVDVHAAD
jgi:hypothetical protein